MIRAAQPNSDINELEWARLGCAIKRGDFNAASEALDVVTREMPKAREMVDRGRQSFLSGVPYAGGAS